MNKTKNSFDNASKQFLICRLEQADFFCPGHGTFIQLSTHLNNEISAIQI